MKIRNIICVYAILMFLTGCSASEDVNVYEYTRKDFPVESEITGVPILGDSIVNPDEAYIVKDTMLLVSNDDPAQKCKIKLYSLNDGHLISSCLSKGHADNELISCDLKYFSPLYNCFYVDDFIQSKYFVCSIDSLCAKKNPLLASFLYSKDVMALYPLDSAYIGFSSWYVNEAKYDNGISCPIGRYIIDNDKKQPIVKECHYYVANVSGASIVQNPHNGDIWVAYKHDDVIEIYDDKMNLKKTMLGPEKTRGKYKTRNIRKQEYVFFDREAYVSSFYSCFFTDKHVYLLHEDKNGVATPPKPKPSEIYKFDWGGNPICNFKLDRQAYEFSLDSNEQNLFAVCIDEANNFQIVKYKIE